MEHRYLRRGLFMLFCMLNSVGWAHDFEADYEGKTIYYIITSPTDLTVAVSCQGDSYNDYSGELTIPASVNYDGQIYTVTSIGEWAFRECSGLISIEIPNSVTSIGEWAFNGCGGLTDVYYHAEQVPSTDSNAFENTDISTATLHVPTSALSAYSTTSPWSGFGTIVAIDGEGDIGKVNSDPDDVPAEAIDLGLPSCTKWASFNVGATKPEEYGGYYAWGETEEKDVYDWNTYIHCDGTSSTCHDLGSDISGTEYDVAHVKWGGDWVMPTWDDIQELLDNCNYEWTTLNDVNGVKFTSKKNGNSIFLPAAGYHWGGDINEVGEGYGYWSSTLYSEHGADYFGFSSGRRYLVDARSSGNSVRPVMHFAPLMLPTESPILKLGEETIIEITSGNGDYTAESDDESVATVRVNDNSTLTIKGRTLGVAKISVTDNISGRTAFFTVLVTKNGVQDDLVDVLPNYFATAYEWGGIPEGYLVNFAGEERVAPNTYGSGSRIFNFGAGGDFTKGLYFREGYVEYGSTEGYPLTLESGKGYLFSFTTAMWKDNGTKTRFEIFNPAGEVVFVQVIDNSPNLNGSLGVVNGASKHSLVFKPDVSGNYIIRWTSSGSETGNPDYMEIILANPEVKCVPNDPNNKVLENWESTNHDDGSTDSHTYQFTAEDRDKLTFDWYVSSERGYDILTITLDGETIVSSSGVNSDTYQTYLTGGTHTLIATYRKDSSVSSNNDNAGIRNIKITGIIIPEGNIEFADANVKAICVENWDTDGDGELSYLEASSVSTLGTLFKGNEDITSFNELQYFVGLSEIGDEAFGDCYRLTSIEIPNSVTSIGNYAFLYCSGLTSIVVASDNPRYDSRNNCNAIIETSTNTLIEGCNATIIPNSVTSIGDLAFADCFGLTSIEIPNSVSSIGYCAFLYCYGLTSIEIPNSVTSIGDYAFYDCSGLTSIEIPNSVSSIGYCAFSYCSGLTSIVVASDNPRYDSRNNCNAIIETSTNTLIAGCNTTIIPNSVSSIGDYAFSYCSCLTSIEIPNSVTSIGYEAFLYCSGLTSIEIPNSVSSIGDYAFDSCSGLTSIVVASDNPRYDSRNNCNAIIETSTNTLIAGCNTTIIPNSVTSIGRGAFYGCYGLTSIEIPNSVTSIGNYAFSYCYRLTSIEIPNSVTSIGSCAFLNCSGLNDVCCHAEQVPSTGDYVFYNSNISSATLHVPTSALSAYSATSPWSGFGTIVAIDGEGDPNIKVLENWESTNHDDGSTDSHTYQFSAGARDKLTFDWYVSSEGGYDILTITLDGETIVSSSGVNSDTYQTYLTAGTHTLIATYRKDGSVSSNNDNAGIRNIKITGFIVPEGNIEFVDANVKAICVENWDTDSDGELSYLEASSVSTLGTLFKGNKDITSFNELQYFVGLSEIGDEAFTECENLTSIEIPDFVTSIGVCAFSMCHGLNNISIPNFVTSLGDFAFSGCINLTSIEIPRSVTSIGTNPFAYNSLSNIVVVSGNPNYDSRNSNAIIETATNTLIAGCKNTVIPNSVTSIGNLAFAGCSDLTSIKIPYTVTIIGDLAFGNCSGLTSVEIPNAVTNIGSQAFANCYNLTKVKIPYSMTNINSRAFESCPALTDVYCSAEQVPSTDSNVFENTDISTATLHVLPSALDSYSSTAPWSGFGAIVAIDAFEEGDSALIVLERNYWIEHGNNYNYPRFTLSFDNKVSLSIGYFNGNYWHSTYNESIKGIHIFSNINGMDEKEWFISDFVTGEWIKEKLIVSENGIVQYYMNDRLIDVVKFDHLNLRDADQVSVDVDPYGWWTGHKQYMDDFVFTTGNLTISDDFNDNSLNFDIWETPVNADGVREEDGVVKLEQLRTDQDFHLRSKSFALRGRIMMVKQILEDWESSNHDDGSTDSQTYQFSAEARDKLTFDWYVSSERGYDILTITLDGETIVSSSGVNSDTYQTYLTAGTHTLIATYRKDGSVSSYNDNAGIKNIKIKGYYVVPKGNIEFADVNVKALCVQNWDTNGDGELSYTEAYLVRDLGAAFSNHLEITSFNELQYFVGLSGIGDDAFNNCTGLTSVKIPYSINSIERYAFKGCTGLTTIEIPYSVTNIGYGVFYGCTGLTCIKIPCSITRIDDRTFEGCIGLTSIEIPNSVTRIEDYAFYGCTGLTSIEIPNSVAIIERSVFAGCTGLTSIEIPWSVTSIEENVFEGCDGLTDIYWTPNAATEAASPLAPSNCVLYLFKNNGENTEKVEQLASLFDGQFKAIYVIEGTLELTAYSSDEPDDDYYYCTYYDHDFSLMITDGEAQAFSATYGNSSLTLHAVENELVYADYPVIFRTTEPHVSLFIVSNVSGTNTADNDLQGTAEEMTVKRSDNIYVLYNGGFHLTEGTIPAHKAYLDLADEMLAPDCLSFAEDGATSINDTNDADDDADGTWYSVNGQRVEKPTKGVFIKNGKKYLFK